MNQSSIDVVVMEVIEDFARAFRARHLAEREAEDGTINSKIHNHFVAELGDDVRYYSSLARSLDSSLGTAIERMAVELAEKNYDVRRHVEGRISAAQTSRIAGLLEAYKSRRSQPKVSDYAGSMLALAGSGDVFTKRHESDYFIRDIDNDSWHLIELKIGGDLDNKKARSEKEALLEQYAILVNDRGDEAGVRIHFATAYNRYGEGKPWKQERVRQFFAEDELLISSDFWNFITKRPDGGQAVQAAYARASGALSQALLDIRKAYLD